MFQSLSRDSEGSSKRMEEGSKMPVDVSIS